MPTLISNLIQLQYMPPDQIRRRDVGALFFFLNSSVALYYSAWPCVSRLGLDEVIDVLVRFGTVTRPPKIELDRSV
jgi:hypothetical protein